MKDEISKERIKLLHPTQISIFTSFIEDLENNLGITIRIVQGFRSFKEQDDIWEQGRTKPGPIVTAAKGGQSYHCFGFAVDIVPLEGGMAGKPNWSYDYSKFEATAKKYGLTWGAAWHDNDHYENDLGRGPHGWKFLLELHNEGKTDSKGYVLLS